jgi:aromatic-L-amino-acid/L-tryptophan decarboxylase
MQSMTPERPDLSFDPATPEEWAALRALGHRMLDDMVAHLETLHDRPAWREMPPDVANSFEEPLPRSGSGSAAAYRAFHERVLPYPNGNLHPRFFGWVQGNGTPLGMLAEMLAAGLNPNVGGFNHAPLLVERQVIRWCAELMGMPEAGGLLVTGGTMANTMGLAVARFAKSRESGRDVRTNGHQAWPGVAPEAPLVFYGSSETHGWAVKAAEWMGLGNRAFRQVPVDADYRIDIDALEAQLAGDSAAGLQPFCIMGTAGTVNTGATDDLVRLSEICRRDNLWFHVDGAFGALAWLSPTLREQVRGLERADSLGFDLHKWGSMPYECACVLIRDQQVHHDAFRTTASYLAQYKRGVTAGGTYYAERGLDLSRGFKALKVWMSFKAHGIDKLVAIIEQNVAHMQHMAARVRAHPQLELLAPVPLNIACLRFTDPSLGEDTLNAFNEELLLRLQERGIAVPSSTMLAGRFAIRVAHVNHRSTLADIDAVVDAVVSIGRELLSERAGTARGAATAIV